jgi:serine/threonine protein kinase
MMSLSLAGPDNDVEEGYGADVAAPAPFPEPEIRRCCLKRQKVILQGEENPITEPWVMETATGNFYELGRILKECQFGQVNHAIQLNKNDDGIYSRSIPYRQFAIKIYSKARIRAKRGRSIENPENEIAAMQCLGSHPNIVQLIECTADHDNVYSIMEFCNGGELFEMIEDEGPVSENRARLLFTQIVQGLAQIHTLGLAHRDMSLENVLLITKNGNILNDDTDENQMESGGDDWENGNGNTSIATAPSSSDIEICKIIDFGMCLVLPRQTTSEDGSISSSVVKIPPQGTSGKRNYIAPEVIENMFPFNPQLSDLWALGVILCIMVTGLCPVEVASPLDPRYRMIRAGLLKNMMEQWGVGLSPEVTDLIYRLLQAVPDHRLAIEEVLRHPWLTMSPTPEDVSSPLSRLLPFGVHLDPPEESSEKCSDGDSDMDAEESQDGVVQRRKHRRDEEKEEEEEDEEDDYGSADNDFDYDDNRLAANARQAASSRLAPSAAAFGGAAVAPQVITPPSYANSPPSHSPHSGPGLNLNLSLPALMQPPTYGVSEGKYDDLRYQAPRSVTREDCMKNEFADTKIEDDDGRMDVIYVLGQCDDNDDGQRIDGLRCGDSKVDRDRKSLLDSARRRRSYDGI